MESVTSSESIVTAALIIGIASTAVTVAMMFLILFIHGIKYLKDRRNRTVLEKWRPILVRAVENVSIMLPKLRRSDIMPFLMLWNHLQESLAGSARENLNVVARKSRVDAMAKRMLQKGTIRQQLIAINTLGHLREKSVWFQLIGIAESRNPLLSIAAARAMFHIDSRGAISVLIRQIASRVDWAPSRVIAILTEADPDVISVPLATAALRASSSQAPRLIGYLSAIHSDYAIETISLILRTSKQDEVLAACLELLKDPRDAELARGFVRHQNWRIRVLAAAALGRIGTDEDEKLFVAMLHDKEWWVRYRAAHAIAEIPSLGIERLKQIELEVQEANAKDIIRLAVAELELP